MEMKVEVEQKQNEAKAWAVATRLNNTPPPDNDESNPCVTNIQHPLLQTPPVLAYGHNDILGCF